MQPTADEGEFGRAINSPLVVFHSAEGELCGGEDLTQGPNTVTNMVKQIRQIILSICLNLKKHLRHYLFSHPLRTEALRYSGRTPSKEHLWHLLID